VSVSPCMQGFRREPLDGGNECAIESQSLGMVSSGLFIECFYTGHGTLKSTLGILKLQ
jgi:hypothetical protein